MEKAFTYVSKIVFLVIMLFVNYSYFVMNQFDTFYDFESSLWLVILIILFIAEIWSGVKMKKAFTILLLDILVLLTLLGAFMVTLL